MKTEKMIKRLEDASEIVSSYEMTLESYNKDEKKMAKKAEDAIYEAIGMVEEFAKLEKKVKKLKKKNAKLKDEIEELKSSKSIASVSLDGDIEEKDNDEDKKQEDEKQEDEKQEDEEYEDEEYEKDEY